jgi:adenosylcobinamide kinase/adenosylcobinamide-phosphate guanylyltransferase
VFVVTDSAVLTVDAAVRLAGLDVRLADGATHHPAPGETIESGAVRVLALPGTDGTTAALVAGCRGGAVLWAPAGPDGTRRLAEEARAALKGAGLSGAALDLRAVGGGLDPRAMAHEVARLRRAEALGPDADLVALGADPATMTGPRRQRLTRRLAPWRVRLAGRDTALGAPPAAWPEPPRRSLVLGPAASGKSAHAEDLLAAEPAVVYLATGARPDGSDPDWAARVARHRERRPEGWSTVEDDDATLLRLLTTAGPPLLLDSVGGWVGAALARCGAWDETPGWAGRWTAQADALVDAWRRCARRVVAVGEETGWGVVPATTSGRVFREALGTLTQRLGEDADRVELVVAGRILDLDDVGPDEGMR